MNEALTPAPLIWDGREIGGNTLDGTVDLFTIPFISCAEEDGARAFALTTCL